MSRLTIIEGNSNNKDNVRVIMVKGEKGDMGDLNHNDIIDNLESSSTDKVLSAKQGKELKDLIDAQEELINKKPYYFDTVAEMKLYELKVGDYAITKGYYEANDGGAGQYEIVDDDTLTDDGGSVIELGNGLKAKLIANKIIYPENFGAKGDGENDDTIPIQKMIDYCNSINKTINFNQKTYKITDTIYLRNNNVNIEGNQATIYSEIDKSIISMASGTRLNNCVIQNLYINGGIAKENSIGLRVMAYHSLFKNISIIS